MPELHEVFDRLKATWREFYVVSDAVQRQFDAVRVGRLKPPRETSIRDYESAIHRLESTYVVRLWAEFEAALRSFRRSRVGNPGDTIRAFDLVNWAQGVEEGRKVDDGVRDLVHEVRDYRNSLVHERDQPSSTVGIDEVRFRLNLFLSKLPVRW